MSDMIHTIYKLCQLQQKQGSAQGLSMDEVVDLERYQAELHSTEFGRQYRRLEMQVSAMVRIPGRDCLVKVLDLSPGGMRLRGCPILETGQQLQVHLRENDERSYRFPGQVIWIRAQDGAHLAGISFVGTPMLLNHGPASDGPENIVDRISVA